MSSSTIAFQGLAGAYSDLACRRVFPRMQTLPCQSFEDAFEAVKAGRAALAMIPVENSVAGRVSDVHHLLPDSGLHIVGEHFERVQHHLLAVKGATVADLKSVRSHVMALGQVRNLIRDLGVRAETAADTAGAARDVAALGDRSVGAIASSLAGEIYGLVSLRANVEDAVHNTTRFLILAREAAIPKVGTGDCVTTLVFEVSSRPAALYKALGGFATNGVNMTKLESYMLHGSFEAVRFHVDAEAHIEDRGMKFALEELRFFSKELKILGVYPAHPYRRDSAAAAAAD
jgi:prephenate dehydratase